MVARRLSSHSVNIMWCFAKAHSFTRLMIATKRAASFGKSISPVQTLTKCYEMRQKSFASSITRIRAHAFHVGLNRIYLVSYVDLPNAAR